MFLEDLRNTIIKTEIEEDVKVSINEEQLHNMYYSSVSGGGIVNQTAHFNNFNTLGVSEHPLQQTNKGKPHHAKKDSLMGTLSPQFD